MTGRGPCGGRSPSAARRRLPPRGQNVVVEQQNAQREREQVEEGVVPGRGDQELQEPSAAHASAQPPRRENQERRHELDREHQHDAGALEPARELVAYHADQGGSGCVS